MGAGLAAPDRDLDPGVTPFEDFVADVTPSFVGRIGVDDVTRLVGMRDELPSSVLSSDRFEPCRDGGFEPGREPGLEVLVGVYPLGKGMSY